MILKQWKEEFRKKFPFGLEEPEMAKDKSEELKSFISSLLTRQKERIVEEVEGKIGDLYPHTPLKLEETPQRDYDKGYIHYQDMQNRAIEQFASDTIQAIKEIEI